MGYASGPSAPARQASPDADGPRATPALIREEAASVPPLDEISPRSGRVPAAARALQRALRHPLRPASASPRHRAALRDRLSALGLSSFRECYQLLRFDDRGRTEMDEARQSHHHQRDVLLPTRPTSSSPHKDEILPGAPRRAHAARAGSRCGAPGCSHREEVTHRHLHPRERASSRARACASSRSDISRARCVARAPPRRVQPLGLPGHLPRAARSAGSSSAPTA